MKFCLNHIQRHSYLLKCDEIKLPYSEKNFVFDYIEKYPGKTIILEIPSRISPEAVNWEIMRNNSILAQGNFICCVGSYELALECKGNHIKFYYGYPVSTFYELRALKKLGVCYVRLTAPLLMQLDRVKQIGIPIRAVPNVAYDQYLPFGDGVCGGWIRPEDYEIYDKYIDVYEFEDCDVNKEQALYRIYAEKKAWPGQMGMLFTNFDYGKVLNRMIPSSLTKKRIRCGQKCQENGGCHLCYRTLDLANPEIYEYLKEQKEALEKPLALN